MNTTSLTCACLWAVITTMAGAQVAESDSLPPTERAMPAVPIPDRYIIEVNGLVNPRGLAHGHGLAPIFVYQKAVNAFVAVVPPGKLAALQRDARVGRIIPDRTVQAIGKPSGGGTSAPVVPEGVKHIGAAPGSLAFNGTGVGVAVVDTGIDFNHADLQPLGAASFSAFSGNAQDNNGHGTHVAGTVAARNNAIDVVGVAPGSRPYAVKVLDASGNGSDSTIIAGLEWVAANAALVNPPIRVANMSLGRQGAVGDNPLLHDAVKALVNANIAVVVAAGNDASLEVSEQVPACYPECIAVASATAKNGTNAYRFFNGVIAADTASYFTTDGPGVTITGPGEDAENISKGGFISSVGILSTKAGGGTTRMSGTSMASPHVAGVAALLWQQAGVTGITPAAIRSKLVAGAANSGNAPLNSPTSGYTFDSVREGILWAPGALSAP